MINMLTLKKCKMTEKRAIHQNRFKILCEEKINSNEEYMQDLSKYYDEKMYPLSRYLHFLYCRMFYAFKVCKPSKK